MGSEYIGFSYEDKQAVQINLLKARLEILNLLKMFANYKRLRSEELSTKIALKNKIGETTELLSRFEKQTPHPKYKAVLPTSESKKEIERDFTIEEEIDNIKKRLHDLGAD